jgi:hypothetical protein
MNRFLLFLLFTMNIFRSANAGEGMWIPLLLDSLNYKDMLEKGLRLSPEEIYSINKASIKDAVVIFGGGCTGELISPEGLLITNHHCGYSRIQSHSTVENNYLTNGFWAGSNTEELPNPGLSVTFLVRIENVTDRILKDVPDSLPEAERNQRVATNASAVRNEALSGSDYEAEVKPFYFGREYYLFIYEIFNDVRLVGAPPEAIGRFGGDTDNWIWPRHTGDFSLFRIYAGKDNKPADYSIDNVPYKPKRYLSISADGIKEGDFTMVLGYPGRTDEYLTSDALSMIAQKSLPAKIDMRTIRLNAIEEEMAKGPDARLKYASKYVSISNSWKKWIGVTKGVKRASVIESKERFEKEFSDWAANLTSDSNGFSSLLREFSRLYDQYEPLYLSGDLGGELLNSLELSSLVNKVQIDFYATHDSSAQFKRSAIQRIKQTGSGFFKSNALEIDRKILPPLLRIYADNTSSQFHPEFYKTIKDKFHGDYQAYVTNLFITSMFTDSIRYLKVFNKSEGSIRKKIMNDPLISVYGDFSRMMLGGVYDRADSLSYEINSMYRKYLSGIVTMIPSRVLYPDANFTMRLAYGKVEGYKPSDAVDYTYYSTLDGIIEKENPDIADYKVPVQLNELYASNDFGSYAVNGKIPVCFIASNHTSGGNSGSPVLNADGNLIGINFDRNWEGTVSDYAFDPAICRNISLDVRYVLFVIDKVAHADRLLDELTIIKH